MRTGVQNLKRHLRARQRGVNSDVHAACQMNRQIGDDPFVAVLGDLYHRESVAGSGKRGCPQGHIGCDLAPPARDESALCRRVKGDVITRFRHAAREKFNKCARGIG